MAKDRLSEDVLRKLEANPPAPDPDAEYAARITLDLSTVAPHVSGPDTVQVMAPVAEMAQKKVAIQKAYLLSCVNSRLEDLASAAEVLSGKKVAPTVKFYIAAASKDVQAQAESKGYWKTLLDAGAIALPPSCGPCIGLGTGLLEAGEVGISATNRNFKGRMGSRDAKCYLAVAGGRSGQCRRRIHHRPHRHSAAGTETRIRELTPKAAAAEKVEILDGFPAKSKAASSSSRRTT